MMPASHRYHQLLFAVSVVLVSCPKNEVPVGRAVALTGKSVHELLEQGVSPQCAIMARKRYTMKAKRGDIRGVTHLRFPRDISVFGGDSATVEYKRAISELSKLAARAPVAWPASKSTRPPISTEDVCLLLYTTNYALLAAQVASMPQGGLQAYPGDRLYTDPPIAACEESRVRTVVEKAISMIGFQAIPQSRMEEGRYVVFSNDRIKTIKDDANNEVKVRDAIAVVWTYLSPSSERMYLSIRFRREREAGVGFHGVNAEARLMEALRQELGGIFRVIEKEMKVCAEAGR